METYEKYKPSGIDWIGEVPEHWEQCRFKNFIQLITKPSNSLVKIGLENIESGSGCFIQTDSEFEGSGVEFLKNDVVYGKLRPYLQKVWLASFDGNAVGDFFVFRVKSNSNATYLKYLLLSDGFTREADGATFGAKMPRVSSDFIMTLRYFLPTLAEQEAIAAYLDARCADIDKVVATQQKRIALLQELKQSEITQAVTRGLNPDARMKDSGVEWIGMVPEHWEVKKLKFVVSCNDDVLNDRTKDDQIIRYVEISDVNSIEGITNSTEYEFKKAPSRARRITKKDDVIVSTVRTYLKAIARIKEEDLIVSTGFAVLRAKNINPVFLAYSTLSELFIGTVISESVGVSYPAINSSDIINIKLPVPPSDEQVEIAEHLDRRCGEIDKQIGAVTKQIELLREYTQALITEVVTGKRRV